MVPYFARFSLGTSLARFGRSRMCPMLDSTSYSEPRYPAMVFAFAGFSTITSFFAMARDTLATCWDTPRVAPRPSLVYILVAVLSWPVLYGLFRLRARGREHLPEGGFVLAANHNSNFDPWPLGIPLFPRRYLRFMAKSELFWTPFKQFATAAGAFPVRRGERDTAAIETAAQLCREGHVVVMFPEGTRRKKGLRKKYEARAHTGAARIALDANVPLVPAGIVGTDRHEALPAYQSGREFDAELLDQLDLAPQLVEAMGFAAAKADGYEADDFLAAAVAFEEARGGTALVASGDRDTFQLASERTTILQPQKGGGPLARIGPAEVRERYGVEPAQVPDFIALRGDPSDRIPGARGVGAKTAASLLAQYGSLEAALEKGRFAAEAESLRLYRHIATMDPEAPLPSLGDQQPTWNRAAALAEEWGLARLAGRLGALSTS